MSILDKAKEKATQLTSQAKEKIDDFKESRKVDELLADIGRATYRQRTGRGEAGDEAAIGDLVRQLQTLEGEGAEVVRSATADRAGTSSPSSTASTSGSSPSAGTSGASDFPPPRLSAD